MQDLFAKVQTVHTDFVFPPLAAHADLAGLEDGAGFAVLPRGLQRHVALGVAVEHAEEVVVGAGHDDAARREEGRVTAQPGPGTAGHGAQPGQRDLQSRPAPKGSGSASPHVPLVLPPGNGSSLRDNHAHRDPALRQRLSRPEPNRL